MENAAIDGRGISFSCVSRCSSRELPLFGDFVADFKSALAFKKGKIV